MKMSVTDADLTKQHLRELVKKLDQALALSDTIVIEADTSVDYGTKDVPSENGMMLVKKHDGLVTVTLRIKMLHGRDAPPLSAGGPEARDAFEKAKLVPRALTTFRMYEKLRP